VGNRALATTRALLRFTDLFLRRIGNFNYSRVRKIGWSLPACAGRHRALASLYIPVCFG
jgi:hypothetical protein